MRVRQSTGELDRTEAEKRLADVILETRERARGGSDRRRTLGEAVRAYLASAPRSRETIGQASRLVQTLGPKFHMDEINQSVLTRLRTELLREKSSLSTYKRAVVAPVRAISNFAAAEFGPREGCPRLVFHRVKEGERRRIVVRPDQAEEMIRYANEQGWHLLALVIQVTVCEGLRRGELHSMEWRFTDLVRRTLSVRDVKARIECTRDRHIADPRGRSLEALAQWQELSGLRTGPVMLGPSKEPFGTKNYFGRVINEQLRAAAEAIKFPDSLYLHALRHTAASWHYLVEPDLERVRKRMDWKTVGITQRYVHLMLGVKPEEVLAFWR